MDITSASVTFMKSISSLNAPVSTQSSPSTVLKYLPFASDIPQFTADPCPPFFLFTSLNIPGYFSSYLADMHAVLSVEPSFIINTSILFINASLINETRHSSIYFSTLYAATEIVSSFSIYTFPLKFIAVYITIYTFIYIFHSFLYNIF